jgi:hypothetical protein
MLSRLLARSRRPLAQGIGKIMRALGILAIALLSSCTKREEINLQENASHFADGPLMTDHSHPDPSLANEEDVSSESSPSSSSKVKRVSIETEELSLDLIVTDSEIQLVSLPSLFKVPLEMRTFQRLSVIFDIDELRSACSDMNFRKQKFQSITGITARALVNPYDSSVIAMALERRGFSLTTHELKGYFDAVSVTPEITAPFLNGEEIEQLKLWFVDQFDGYQRQFGFSIAGSLNVDKPEFIMTLSRLICGIVHQEAYIDFVLKDERGKILTVRIDEAKFVVY